IPRCPRDTMSPRSGGACDQFGMTAQAMIRTGRIHLRTEQGGSAPPTEQGRPPLQTQQGEPPLQTQQGGPPLQTQQGGPPPQIQQGRPPLRTQQGEPTAMFHPAPFAAPLPRAR